MKINLNALNNLYIYLKSENLLDKIDGNREDLDENDLKQYVLSTIIDNLEYDFGINFSDYVDLNDFVEYD
jgi:hypothetical protein